MHNIAGRFCISFCLQISMSLSRFKQLYYNSRVLLDIGRQSRARRSTVVWFRSTALTWVFVCLFCRLPVFRFANRFTNTWVRVDSHPRNLTSKDHLSRDGFDVSHLRCPIRTCMDGWMENRSSSAILF